ncbi:MAG: host nuclease inhibitor protein [Burkholderiales bacterium]|nr:host nuclease inhibitor protein [Burkholderiales bacterium]
MNAYAWRSGRIDFGRKTPEGALTIATGPAKKIKGVICATARHAYDGVTLLVPGIPEAANDDAALDALLAYQDWIVPRFIKEAR